MKKLYILLALLCPLLQTHVSAADSLRVLFIGNSYTYMQNLPDVVSQLASAGGDNLYYQSSAPGGATFQQHCLNPATLNYISQGGWDYVVLQEQSQLPSFQDDQVAAEVYPYARKLDSLVHVYSPCAKTMFYMTWGRKNGDAQNCGFWPPVCTYQGMDSLLQRRYGIMAADNNAMLCPVATVWRRLRTNNPGLELYQSDESHPSAAGTYAAALSFYSLFFRKEPLNTSYNFILNTADAQLVKAAAQAVVYDSTAYWKRHYPLPRIDSISAQLLNGGFRFAGVNPENVLGYEWDFGDNSPHSSAANPDHTYSSGSTHTVCVTLFGACDTVVYCLDVNAGPVGIAELYSMESVLLYPNPVQDRLLISGLTTATGYRIYTYTGVLAGEGRTAAGQHSLSVASLPAGMYYLELRNDGKGRKMFRFVKQ